MEEKKILALDMGLRNMGYAIGAKPNKLIEWGTWHTYARNSFEKRKVELLENIYRKIEQYGINLVVMEMYRVYQDYRKAQHVTIELIGALKEGLRLKFPKTEWEEVNKNWWEARLRRIMASGYYLHMGEVWEKALSEGSEHSRDAVSILLVYVFDIKALFVNKK